MCSGDQEIRFGGDLEERAELTEETRKRLLARAGKESRQKLLEAKAICEEKGHEEIWNDFLSYDAKLDIYVVYGYCDNCLEEVKRSPTIEELTKLKDSYKQ